jgi:hypothetical protein
LRNAIAAGFGLNSTVTTNRSLAHLPDFQVELSNLIEVRSHVGIGKVARRIAHQAGFKKGARVLEMADAIVMVGRRQRLYRQARHQGGLALPWSALSISSALTRSPVAKLMKMDACHSFPSRLRLGKRNSLPGCAYKNALLSGWQGRRLSGRIIFLVCTAHDDLQSIVGQGTLQRLRFIPRRAHPVRRDCVR